MQGSARKNTKFPKQMRYNKLPTKFNDATYYRRAEVRDEKT